MIAMQYLGRPLSKGFIFTLSCVALMSAPVQAQISPGKNLEPLKLPPLPKKELPKKKFGNWTQVCETRPGVVRQKCFLTQTVVQTKEGRKLGLLGITVGNFGPQKKLGAITNNYSDECNIIKHFSSHTHS